MVIWYDDDDMMMMMIDDDDDDEYPWKNCANHTVLRIDLLKVCIVVKTELTLLGGLATACSRPCDQNKRQLSQHSLRLHFLLRSSFLKVPDYFFASLMLLMMIDDLSSERVHDKNIRKVIKHFQKTKSLAGASQNSLKIRYFRIFSSHQKNAIPDKNFVSR